MNPTPTAILVDGANFKNRLRTAYDRAFKNSSMPRHVSLDDILADHAYSTILAAVEYRHPNTEQLFRIYYFDAYPPSDLDNQEVNRTYLDELSRKPHVLMRYGNLKRGSGTYNNAIAARTHKGPIIDKGSVDENKTGQKGVDVAIGIEMARLAFKGWAKRIILISNDVDIIPAMALARDEGVQVVVGYFKEENPNRLMEEYSDESRVIRISLPNLPPNPRGV